jgi:hypothetical protein
MVLQVPGPPETRMLVPSSRPLLVSNRSNPGTPVPTTLFAGIPVFTTLFASNFAFSELRMCIPV